MYIRKQTLIIGGILVTAFVVGNIILMVKENKEGKKVNLRSVVEIAREGVKAYNNGLI